MEDSNSFNGPFGVVYKLEVRIWISLSIGLALDSYVKHLLWWCLLKLEVLFGDSDEQKPDFISTMVVNKKDH